MHAAYSCSECPNTHHRCFHKKSALKNLDLLGIPKLRKKSFSELSGGQQQRVLLARALCTAKKMLILDEPVTGLDPDAAEEMYSLIEKLNKEIAEIVAREQKLREGIDGIIARIGGESFE